MAYISIPQHNPSNSVSQDKTKGIMLLLYIRRIPFVLFHGQMAHAAPPLLHCAQLPCDRRSAMTRPPAARPTPQRGVIEDGGPQGQPSLQRVADYRGSKTPVNTKMDRRLTHE